MNKPGKPQRRQHRKPKGLVVDGWLIIDKPSGIGSTDVVTRVKRAFNAQKCGHGGTLDPLATGVLPIAFGTDCGSPAVGHDVIAPEMAFMVKIGVKKDNYDAVRSATAVSAKLNKLDQSLGTLQAGKLADVIVVDGDPREEIEAIGRVRLTFLEGRRMHG